MHFYADELTFEKSTLISSIMPFFEMHDELIDYMGLHLGNIYQDYINHYKRVFNSANKTGMTIAHFDISELLDPAKSKPRNFKTLTHISNIKILKPVSFYGLYGRNIRASATMNNNDRTAIDAKETMLAEQSNYLADCISRTIPYAITAFDKNQEQHSIYKKMLKNNQFALATTNEEYSNYREAMYNLIVNTDNDIVVPVACTAVLKICTHNYTAFARSLTQHPSLRKIYRHAI